jgi:hypothetical protein
MLTPMRSEEEEKQVAKEHEIAAQADHPPDVSHDNATTVLTQTSGRFREKISFGLYFPADLTRI